MGNITPDPKKRSYLLSPGCKDLIDVLNGPPAKPSLAPKVRINGQIRAPEVRVIGEDGRQLGILRLADALSLAKTGGIDLVEIAPNARPPVCRLADFGEFRYESAKRRKKKS
jgi:translation initiation factor IF-3